MSQILRLLLAPNLQNSSQENHMHTCGSADHGFSDCNSFVSTVFNISSGQTTGGASTPTKTAVSYSAWVKDEN